MIRLKKMYKDSRPIRGVILQHQHPRQVKIRISLFLFHYFGVCIYMQYFFDLVRNQTKEVV